MPIVGLSATSCPSSMPQCTWDIAAGMLYVADKPTEIRPRRGRRHSTSVKPYVLGNAIMEGERGGRV
jgi:hypothetical protein